MALNVGPRTENPFGAAFSGMMNMKMQQKQWNKFLDAFGPNGAGNQGGQPVGALQQNPQAGIGIGIGPGMGQNTPATMGGLNQMFGQPQRPNMLQQGLQGIGQGIGAMGRGLGGMLGMNQPQNPMAMGAPGMMRGGAMGQPNPMMGNPMTGNPMSMMMNPLMLQMLRQQRARNPFAMGGY